MYQAVARAWAQAGAAGIVLVGRKAESLNLTVDNVAKISNSIPVLTQPADIADESSVKTLFEKVKAKFGKAHVLVNAAGSMGGGMIGDAPLASWWQDFVSGLEQTVSGYSASNLSSLDQQEINVKGVFLIMQSFIQNFGAEGTIINLVSVAVALPVPGISSYASSKLAAVKLVQAVNIGTSKLPTPSLPFTGPLRVRTYCETRISKHSCLLPPSRYRRSRRPRHDY